MSISALRDGLNSALLSFAWDEWGQMGVLSSPQRSSPWAQDPEALLVLTFEVAREEPRLFDEVLDWLATNESLVSTRRLRALCTVEGDEQLVEAALDWVGRHRGRKKREPVRFAGPHEQLFRNLTSEAASPDESFLAHGLIRPIATPSGKSSVPDFRQPINLAFRIRQLMGLGVRAEVVRALLTIDAASVNTSVLTNTAAFTRRNVQEAVSSLESAGVAKVFGTGREFSVAIDQSRWRIFLGEEPDWRVEHRDWPELYAALRTIHRWLRRPELESMSDYMLSSRARDLLEQVREDLDYAGAAVRIGRTAAEAWPALEETVGRALDALVGDSSEPARRAPAGTLEVFRFTDGGRGWLLRSGNGRQLARSPSGFATDDEAVAAARYVLDRASHLNYDIYEGSSPGFWWRGRAVNGEVVVQSPDVYTSRYNAVRAAERMQRVAAEPISLVVS